MAPLRRTCQSALRWALLVASLRAAYARTSGTCRPVRRDVAHSGLPSRTAVRLLPGLPSRPATRDGASFRTRRPASPAARHGARLRHRHGRNLRFWPVLPKKSGVHQETADRARNLSPFARDGARRGDTASQRPRPGKDDPHATTGEPTPASRVPPDGRNAPASRRFPSTGGGSPKKAPGAHPPAFPVAPQA